MSDLLNRLPSAFLSHAITAHLIWLGCFCDVWGACKKGGVGKFKGLCKAHAFKTPMNFDGQVAVHHKGWGRHTHWGPCLKGARGESGGGGAR